MDGKPTFVSSVRELDMPKAKIPVVETVADSKIKDVVIIESLIEAHLTYTGRESGQLYVWKKSGDTVSVLEVDAPELLAKRLGGSLCCGNHPEGNKIFQIVGGG